MTEHMRVIDGEVKAQSSNGEFAIRRFDLNEKDFAAYRAATITAINKTRASIDAIDKRLEKLRKKFLAGDVTDDRRAHWQARFDANKSDLVGSLSILTGTVPLPP